MVETYQCALLSARPAGYDSQQGRNQIHDKETHLPPNLDQGCLIVGHLLKTRNQATEAVCEVVRAGGLDTPATHSLSASIALRLPTAPPPLLLLSDELSAPTPRPLHNQSRPPSHRSRSNKWNSPLKQKNPITGTLTESGLCIDFEPFCLESQSKFS